VCRTGMYTMFASHHSGLAVLLGDRMPTRSRSSGQPTLEPMLRGPLSSAAATSARTTPSLSKSNSLLVRFIGITTPSPTAITHLCVGYGAGAK